MLKRLSGRYEMTDPGDVEISHLGAQGDGVANSDGKQVFVSGALPGERWQLTSESPVQLTASPDRQQPVCQHFASCGGCVAQHMGPDLYTRWKTDALVNAFGHRGIDVNPEPLRSVGPGARRRTTFSFRRTATGTLFGYYRSGSHEVVPVKECPVLQKEISSRLVSLSKLADCVARDGQDGRMVVTALDCGLDIAVTAPGVTLSQNDCASLSARAREIGAVALTLNGDPLIEATLPILTINGARLEAPASVFLQAAPEAEQWIAGIIEEHAKRAKSAVDLFCGVGTFTFPLARKSKVSAFDGQADAISSLTKSVKNNQGFKPITARQRDLFRDPLSGRELRAFDLAVIDPPRAGAAEQIERLANSSVKTIVMISCNPATMARDARRLIDGGYHLLRLVPIDQFVYSAHLEAVAVFERAPRPRS